MSVFKAMLNVCNLSIADGAEFLGLSASLVKQYSAGNRTPPDSVFAALAALYDQICEVSEHCFERDEITPEGVQAIAIHEHGSPLPKPALDAVAAMFILTRMMDDE